MNLAYDIVVPGLDILGEGPVWNGREQALYWVDIRAPAVRRLDPSTGERRSWAMPELCPGVGFDRNGPIVALRRFIVSLDTDNGATRPLVEVEPAALDNRLNEMRCDRQGRIWVGSMRDFGAAVTGSLYRIVPPRVTKMLEPVHLPNGIAWSPDSRTMYFADTGDKRVRAYDFDAASGAMSGMRILVAAEALPGVPDGCAIDADGCMWSVRYGAGMIVRITPDGRIDRKVELPATQPTACAFGGSDLRTLYVTSARQRLTDEALAQQPHAGSIFALRPDVGGLPEPVVGIG